MPECLICYKQKLLFELDCSHSFCHRCIHQWSSTNLSKPCPICRKVFTLPTYNTRNKDYETNKKYYIQHLKNKINEYASISVSTIKDKQKQLDLFHEIFSFLYEHKQILKNESKLKQTVLDKIQYLKQKGIPLGYYWDQKMYSI